MIKFVLMQWDKNKAHLEEVISNTPHYIRVDWDYGDLATIVMENILNHNPYNNKLVVDIYDIDVVNIGSGVGVKLFIIPFDTSDPSEDDFLLSYVNYGSCSACDTLKRIQYDDSYGDDPEQVIKDYMILCRDICANIIRPYNSGWRHDDIFDTVIIEDNN